MKQIKSFKISKQNISPGVSIKNFKVSGDDGAVFSLKIQRANGDFYNFTTNTFDTSVNNNNSLHRLANIVIDENGYEGTISLPANSDGDDYKFMLFAEPHFDTIISPSLLSVKTTGSGDSFLQTESYNPYFYSTRITQDAESTITLTWASKANSSKYQAFGSAAANVTLSRDPNSTGIALAKFSITFNAALADNANGFELVRQPIGSDFEVSSTTSPGGTSYNVSSSIIASNELIVDTIDGLGIGDFISNNFSGATAPVIVAIDEGTNTLILDRVQTLNVGTTLTFTGGGASAIESFSGAQGVEFLKLFAEVPEFQIKLNGAHSGTGAISIDSAVGLFLGQKVRGPNFDNETNGEMTITSIDRSGNTFNVGATQTLDDNTSLTISGGGNVANIKGVLSVSVFPKNDLIITLDLDKILTPKGIT